MRFGGEDFEIVKMSYPILSRYKTLATERTLSKEIRIISAGESMDEDDDIYLKLLILCDG